MAVGDRDRGGNGEVCRAIKEHFDILEYIKASLPDLHFKEQGGSTGSYKCIEHDSLVVTPGKGLFIWYSRGAQGSVIDFVMFNDNLPKDEAISRLRQEMAGQPIQFSPAKYTNFTKEKKPLLLPPAKEGKYSRVFAYLTKTRCIDSNVVADVVRRKMLYEDAQHHNCIFVGFGDDGKPSYAAVRGTGQSPNKIRWDVSGSKKTGWFVDNKAPALFVTEAPIDALSVMTLMKLGGKNYKQYSYLAQGGCTAIETLEKCVSNNPNIKRIYLCYDNDSAGRIAVVNAQEMLKGIGFQGSVIDKIPILNDFNDDLKAHVGQQAPIQQQTPNLQEVIIYARNGC